MDLVTPLERQYWIRNETFRKLFESGVEVDSIWTSPDALTLFRVIGVNKLDSVSVDLDTTQVAAFRYHFNDREKAFDLEEKSFGSPCVYGGLQFLEMIERGEMTLVPGKDN